MDTHNFEQQSEVRPNKRKSEIVVFSFIIIVTFLFGVFLVTFGAVTQSNENYRAENWTAIEAKAVGQLSVQPALEPRVTYSRIFQFEYEGIVIRVIESTSQNPARPLGGTYTIWINPTALENVAELDYFIAMPGPEHPRMGFLPGYGSFNMDLRVSTSDGNDFIRIIDRDDVEVGMDTFWWWFMIGFGTICIIIGVCLFISLVRKSKKQKHLTDTGFDNQQSNFQF